MPSSVGSLPELIAPIVEHLRNDTATLHSTALVSSAWLDLSRKQLFRRFTIPRNDEGDTNEDEHPSAEPQTIMNAALLALPRLTWLVLHPAFAAYVTELEVHTKHMAESAATTGPPGLDTFMLLFSCIAPASASAISLPIFPNVHTVRMVDEGYCTGYQTWLINLAPHLPRFRDLHVEIHPRTPVTVLAFFEFGVQHLSLMSRESSSAQSFMQCLVFGGFRAKNDNPLETIKLVLVDDITVSALIVTVACLSFFKRLREIDLTIRLDRNAKLGPNAYRDEQMAGKVFETARHIMRGARPSPFADLSADKNDFDVLSTLSITVVGDETYVPLLQSLLYGATLPALRSLRIKIDLATCVAKDDPSRADFRPFLKDQVVTISGSNQDGSNIRPLILSPDLVHALEHLDIIFCTPPGVDMVYIHDSTIFLALLGGIREMDACQSQSNTMNVSHERPTGRVCWMD
jgi:hypothetical protein